MARRFIQRKKRRRIIPVKDCQFCKLNKEPDYKDMDNLRQFITDRGKLLPRIINGICQKHQRRLAQSIKQARYLALLPFIVRPS